VERHGQVAAGGCRIAEGGRDRTGMEAKERIFRTKSERLVGANTCLAVATEAVESPR
jgi:hypothetical protein